MFFKDNFVNYLQNVYNFFEGQTYIFKNIFLMAIFINSFQGLNVHKYQSPKNEFSRTK